MTSEEHIYRKGDREPAEKAAPARTDEGKQPEWTAGLRHLYDSVVEEPLPDSFRDLLAQLDSGN